VQTFYLAASYLKASSQDEEMAIAILKLEIYTYLYWVNRNELLAVS
jgi:hypothetical protein